jgi:hypothetical protein
MVRLEKLTAAEPLLLEKLTGARSAVRRLRWQDHHAAYLNAAKEFVASARAAAESHRALVAIVGAARSEGFDAEARFHMPATPNIEGHPFCAPDLITKFEEAANPPPATQTSPQPYRPPKFVDRYSGPLLRTVDHRGPVSLAPGGATGLGRASWAQSNPRTSQPPTPSSRPTPPSRDVPNPAAGEARVVALRHGFEDAQGRQMRAGEFANLPIETARHAARNGAVEIVEAPVATESLPRVDAAAPSAENSQGDR